MTEFFKCDSNNKDFINLVKLLDVDLALRDGEDHSFYSQYNKINTIKHAIVLYINNKFVACGAIKEFNTECMEVKRMYTLPDFRGQGIATKILIELENWAKELGFNKCMIETVKRQREAIKCMKNGSKTTQNYGQYVGVKNSVCFEKFIK